MSRNVKIRYFLSRNAKIRAMRRKMALIALRADFAFYAALYRSTLRTPQRQFLNFHSARTTLQLKAAQTAHTQLTQKRKTNATFIINDGTYPRPHTICFFFFPQHKPFAFPPYHMRLLVNLSQLFSSFLNFTQFCSIFLNFLNFFLSKLFSTFLPHPQIYNN